MQSPFPLVGRDGRPPRPVTRPLSFVSKPLRRLFPVLRRVGRLLSRASSPLSRVSRPLNLPGKLLRPASRSPSRVGRALSSASKPLSPAGKPLNLFSRPSNMGAPLQAAGKYHLILWVSREKAKSSEFVIFFYTIWLGRWFRDLPRQGGPRGRAGAKTLGEPRGIECTPPPDRESRPGGQDPTARVYRNDLGESTKKPRPSSVLPSLWK